jgi:ferredoxin
MAGGRMQNPSNKPEKETFNFITKENIQMKVSIINDCINCGTCVDTCPDVFVVRDDIVQVNVDYVPAEHEEAVRKASDECPVEAIAIE